MSDEKFKILAKSIHCIAGVSIFALCVSGLDLSKVSLSVLGGLFTGEK